MFYDRYIELCSKANKKPYTVSRELGLGSSNVAIWKKGSTPRPEIIQKIADYFDVSVGYLLGYDEQKNKPTTDGSELSETQREAIKLLETMSDDQLRQFIRIAKAVLGE